MSATTIVLRPSEDGVKDRAITKILELQDGFAVAVPYHDAKTCFLMKAPVDYSKELSQVAIDDCITCEASSRAKLSIHFPGFAQFSGEDNRKIVSGRDPVTGEPRGLGVVDNQPFNIWSGPTVIIGFWGLEDFREYSKKKKAIIVHENRSTLRRLNNRCLPEFSLEIWMLENKWKSRIFNYLGQPTVQLELPNSSGLGYPQYLSVIPLEGKSHFLGLILIKHIGRENYLSDREPTLTFPRSGFTMGGPSAYDENGISWGLQAFYPKPELFPIVKSLDRDVS